MSIGPWAVSHERSLLTAHSSMLKAGILMSGPATAKPATRPVVPTEARPAPITAAPLREVLKKLQAPILFIADYTLPDGLIGGEAGKVTDRKTIMSSADLAYIVDKAIERGGTGGMEGYRLIVLVSNHPDAAREAQRLMEAFPDRKVLWARKSLRGEDASPAASPVTVVDFSATEIIKFAERAGIN